MTEKIKLEIEKFQKLQEKHSESGAEDSEPDYMFQLVIAHALAKQALDFSENLDWELYDEASEITKRELTEQAAQVYKTILSHCQEADFNELRKFCWRLDAEEFGFNDK